MFKSFHYEKTTVTSKVVNYLKELIQQKEIISGEKLPSEREMSDLLHVSRNTVRESYKILETLGYVQIKHGQGVFVSDVNSSIDQWAATFFIKNDQIKELFEIRKLLETQSVRWAAERSTDEQVTALKSKVEWKSAYKKELENIDRFTQADHDFHLTLARMTGNSVLLRVMYNLIDLLKEVRDETIRIPGRLLKSAEEHIDIVQAIEARDPVIAESAMLNHLNSVEEALFSTEDE